ncbi:MAG: hypothetical protein AAGA03_18985 [Planctomycetota bacterium]
MWKPESLGQAAWIDSGNAWSVRAPGGEDGIQVVDGAIEVRCLPTGKSTLPIASEQFVRGDQWHITYPQGDGEFAVETVYRVVTSTANQLILEVTYAVQTDRLDSHPTLDLVSEGDGYRCVTPAGAELTGAESDIGASAITEVMNGDVSVSILLGPRDYPFTLDLSDDNQIRLRLFGDFLEKGVIRKARPWIVIERGDDAGNDDRLTEIWRQLCESPLPLTA